MHVSITLNVRASLNHSPERLLLNELPEVLSLCKVPLQDVDARYGQKSLFIHTGHLLARLQGSQLLKRGGVFHHAHVLVEEALLPETIRLAMTDHLLEVGQDTEVESFVSDFDHRLFILDVQVDFLFFITTVIDVVSVYLLHISFHRFELSNHREDGFGRKTFFTCEGGLRILGREIDELELITTASS